MTKKRDYQKKILRGYLVLCRFMKKLSINITEDEICSEGLSVISQKFASWLVNLVKYKLSGTLSLLLRWGSMDKVLILQTAGFQRR